MLASIFADAGKTPSAIRADIFKADDRLNSRGDKIAGNGLAAHGAVIVAGARSCSTFTATATGSPGAIRSRLKAVAMTAHSTPIDENPSCGRVLQTSTTTASPL